MQSKFYQYLSFQCNFQGRKWNCQQRKHTNLLSSQRIQWWHPLWSSKKCQWEGDKENFPPTYKQELLAYKCFKNKGFNCLLKCFFNGKQYHRTIVPSANAYANTSPPSKTTSKTCITVKWLISLASLSLLTKKPKNLLIEGPCKLFGSIVSSKDLSLSDW